MSDETRVAKLETALRACRCPYPMLEDVTIGACVDGGHCGCCLGEPLMSAAQKAAAAVGVEWSPQRTNGGNDE